MTWLHNAALARRASRQIAGKPIAFNACQCQVDNAPVSNPIRRGCWLASLTPRSRGAHWRECREPSSNFYVCRVSINKSVKIIDLAQSEGLEPILQALIFSSLMSAPSSEDSGWYQPQYVLTRFVADCVKAAGAQGIIYPSVRCGEGK